MASLSPYSGTFGASEQTTQQPFPSSEQGTSLWKWDSGDLKLIQASHDFFKCIGLTPPPENGFTNFYEVSLDWKLTNFFVSEEEAQRVISNLALEGCLSGYVQTDWYLYMNRRIKCEWLIFFNGSNASSTNNFDLEIKLFLPVDPAKKIEQKNSSPHLRSSPYARHRSLSPKTASPYQKPWDPQTFQQSSPSQEPFLFSDTKGDLPEPYAALNRAFANSSNISPFRNSSERLKQQTKNVRKASPYQTHHISSSPGVLDSRGAFATQISNEPLRQRRTTMDETPHLPFIPDEAMSDFQNNEPSQPTQQSSVRGRSSISYLLN